MSERTPTKPTCKALLLCDDTIIEAGTGKISLIGVFRQFALPRFPARTRAFRAFVQITNAAGRYDFLVQLKDLSTDDVMAEATGIEIEDRLDVFNIVIPVPPLPLEHPGEYDFVVFANSDEIDRQSFRALELPRK
jgi:hypothetical protein